MSKILVTGAGALLGQGVLRCLNASENNYDIVSADPDTRSTGHALANICYTVPFVNDPKYLDRIEEIIKKEGIELIFIGTDVELPIFAENQKRLEKKHGLKIVVSREEVIGIANDKWLTAEFLKKNNYPYPISALTTDKKNIGLLQEMGDYPYIAKPIDGARSQGILSIRNEEELNDVCAYQNNLVVQEMLSEDDGEFTTGCVVINGECKAMVSLVRDLRDGNTWRTYRENPSKYDSLIAEIAEKLGVEGPVNFQYRIKNGQPVIFEINCRFSGTTPIRHIYGFNEVEAIAEYYLNGKPIKRPDLKTGVVLRTFSDLFVSNEMLKDFQEKKLTADFNAEFIPFNLNHKK